MPSIVIVLLLVEGQRAQSVIGATGEGVVEAFAARMETIGDAMAIRRETVEHPFATIKAWMGASHFLCKGLKAVRTEMSLHVLAYNFRRVLATLGVNSSGRQWPPDAGRRRQRSHRRNPQ